MKNLILAAVVVFSGVVSAQDMIKTFDGSIARCESAADVYQYKFHAVYRPLLSKKLKSSTDIKIEFLKCVESKGEFKFVRDNNFQSRTVMVEGIEYKIERTEPKLIVSNDMGRIANENTLKKNADNTYSASLNTVGVAYDNSPEGKQSLLVAVQSIFKLTEVSTGKIIDSGYETLGSYRLIVK